MTYHVVYTEDRGNTARLISRTAGDQYRRKYDLAVKRLSKQTIHRQELGKIKARILRSIRGGCTYKIVYVYETISPTQAKLTLLNLCVRDRSKRYHIVNESGGTDVPCS